MFRQGPIPVTLHAASEPFLVVLLLAAPFLFGFSDEGAPTALAIIAGLLILVVSMSTKWKLSLVKVIPLSGHAIADVGLGAVLVASPFIFGFSDETAPTVFFMAFGILEVLATLATRWGGDSVVAPRAPRVSRA